MIVAFLSSFLSFFFFFLLLLVFILMDIFQYKAKVIVVSKYFQPDSLGMRGRQSSSTMSETQRGEKH